MKLTIIGGGGFRVPQIFEALSGDNDSVRITELCLFDAHPQRVLTIQAVLNQMASSLPRPPRVTTANGLDEAIIGARFIFSAMRISGTAGRIMDERIALNLGVLGQETTGPGGLAYALRTLPHARDLAQRVARLAPEAMVINFTNPAGIITEAMRESLGDRVVGICDTPIGLIRRAVHAIGATDRQVDFDYVGLNHLGWLRSLVVDGEDKLPALLADDAALESIEEARLMGLDWIRALGAIPNEYLYYYYFQREATARLRGSGQTRGEFLHDQQGHFYELACEHPDSALELWQRTKHEREASYMAESRPEDQRSNREASDIEGGGYQQVALDLMTALLGGTPATMILNVANRGLVPQLPDEAVIEVPCRVTGAGIVPMNIAPVTGEMLGLLQQLKAVEQLVIAAAKDKSETLAWRALAAHPLVDSISVAKQLLQTYKEQIPGVAEVFLTP
ncbi:6-phospho-beta-glucosidase [Paeniglutamicibacter terrestris]|uniref:6-phospho-beta-glucosidase n=1 Tax=Paeniglutamicibacter terrestris TaxID=2723403 RepID=A0ABX1G2S7_9MICC|nr:6-phospho-beta-glucosidase [Paeniglutamicibacter terrestris]ASN39694.1 6-phospho-beta-glucosidase [Arthrobacter sp. 7749]NKG20553.1 6-phospho-beta-glucosidase [Paeniglutamicibacter terrestris]